MDIETKVTIEALVTLRQMFDQRIDAEIFRLTNGLYPIKETADELVEMIKGSAYAELLSADRIVVDG